MNKLPLVLILCIACTAPTLEAFSMTGECQETCSSARRSCREQGTRSANRCFDTCFGSSCYYCNSAGDSIEATCLRDVEAVCGDSGSGCAEHNFRGHPGGYDVALEERCVEYFDACEGEADSGWCTHFAQVEGVTATAAYECLAANACDAEVCPWPEADAPLAAAYKSEIGSCGWSSTVSEVDLALIFGWLRHDVRDSLRSCLAMSCANGRVHCANAWLAAVLPE